MRVMRVDWLGLISFFIGNYCSTAMDAGLGGDWSIMGGTKRLSST